MPDLTFSEMGFLASRRDRSKELNNNTTKRHKEKGRAADEEDEISRFFSSGKQVLAERDLNRQDKQFKEAAHPYHKTLGHAKRAVSRGSDERQSPYPPIELPEKPFLGFGNRGAQPLSSIESRCPTGRVVLSAAPSEVTQHMSSHSTASYTWSRSGNESKSTSPKRNKDALPISGFPVASTAFNSAAPSIEVGQLDQTSNSVLHLPDTQAILSHEKPRPYSSSAESTRHAHHKIAAQPPQSQPVVDAHRPTAAGKACLDTGKLQETVKNTESEPTVRTTDIGHNVHVIPTDAEGSPIQSNEPEKQVEHLNSLLDACKTTLSGLWKIGHEPPNLRAKKPSLQQDSIGLGEALSLLNARSKRPPLSSTGVATAEHAWRSTLPGGPREDTTGSPEQSAANWPNLVGLTEDGPSKNPEDVSEVEPIKRRTRQPMPSTCGVHTQQSAPCKAATDLDHRTASFGSHELQDTRTPLADSRLSNPHQSPRFTYVNADTRQGFESMYAPQYAREGHSTDWLGSSRYTPLGLGAWTLPDSNYDVGDGRLRTGYGTSRSRPAEPRDMENVPDDSNLDHVETHSGDHRDSPGYEHQTMSPENHHRGPLPWSDEVTDGALRTYMLEDTLDDEAIYTQEVAIERDVNHLALGSDTDEPTTRFWHPHRLY